MKFRLVDKSKPAAIAFGKQWRCATLVAYGAAAILALSLQIPPCAGQEAPAPETSLAPAAAGATPVDFAAEIEPIFRDRCYACHGRELRNGGLRLDEREFAAEGGDSRLPILGGTLESNEIYTRVASPDETYRMPKRGPALSDLEIDAVRRWVLAGTPWPETPDVLPSPGGSGNLHAQRYDGFWDFLALHLPEVSRLRGYIWAALAFMLLALLSERSRQARQAGRPATRGRYGKVIAALAAVRPSHCLAAVLAIALTAAIVRSRERERDWKNKCDVLQTELSKHNPPAVDATLAIYGSPPEPIRLSHPKQIEATYYRGNCERNASLFNGGNYRTATLHLNLCDSDRKIVRLGDAVPAGGLFIRFEIIRAPGASDVLFSKEIMSSIFLTKEVLKSDPTPTEQPHVELAVAEPEQRWEAFFPIGQPATADDQKNREQRAAAKDEPEKMTGLVYVYKGRVEQGKARGEFHYGIKYELLIEGGHLAAGSDLWMGSLYWNTSLAKPERGKVPLDEWFDYRPIPEITGPNSTDPLLLGVPEHVKPQAGQQPAEASK